ncbi:MAG: nucleotide exchange factor GrpE [Elusimicrobiota bacterium]
MSSKNAEKQPEEEQEPAPAEQDAAAAEDSASAEALAAAEEENRRLMDQLVRMKAEFENFRKRVDRDKPGLIRHGRDEVLIRLLPLYDVLLAAHDQVRGHAEDAEWAAEVVRGLELTFKEFTKFFESEGISAMESIGRPYDVDRHEVLGQVETDEYEDGTVLEEIQRGYLIQGKTLRTAKVRIAKAK